MVIGVGIDIIEVARIRAMMRKHSDRFLDRVFTPGERAYCEKARRAAEHFAARFAAKEAFMKALGTGLSAGIVWTDVEVAHEAGGRPILILHNAAALLARQLGVTNLQLSLTHVASNAAAVVVAQGGIPAGIVKRKRSELVIVRGGPAPLPRRSGRKPSQSAGAATTPSVGRVDKPARSSTLRPGGMPLKPKRHRGRGGPKS